MAKGNQPKFVTIGSKWVNRFTKATYLVTGFRGLTVFTTREDTGEQLEQHYSNMKNCFIKIEEPKVK